MARIKTYSQDTPVSKIDKVLGTDGDPGINYGATKNFTVASLAAFIGGGSAGTAGASAYDLWVTAGNSGTVADFLTSLVGASGSQGAAGATGGQGASGADGTSINIQGTKPTVGDLPASGATGDLWIIDQTGGGATAGDGYVWTAGGAWANIGPLRGPQGIQGAAGAQGIQGIQGTQGVQGIQGVTGTAGSTTKLLTFTPGILFSDGTSPTIVASAGKLIRTEYTTGRFIYKFQGDVTFDSSGTNGNALNNVAFKVTASNISEGTLSIDTYANSGTEYGNLAITYNVSQATTFSSASSNLRPAFFQSTATTAEWKTRHSEMNLKDNTFNPGTSFNMTFVNGGNVRVFWESTLTD
mgnify:FL=1